MADPRVVKMAHTLVNYSMKIKEGEMVVLQSEPAAAPLIKEMYREILLVGGNPVVHTVMPGISRILLNHGNDQQLQWISPYDRLGIETADVRIRIDSQTNTRELSQVDPERQSVYQKSRSELMGKLMSRTHAGDFRWCVTLFPTEGLAQDANMSLPDFEDFVYGVCFLNEADPIAKWQELHDKQAHLINFLHNKREVHIVGEGTDIRLGIAGRSFVNCAGDANFPDGEFFTGPEENNVNGIVRFSFPAIYNGREVEDVQLTFEAGKVVKATAKSGQDFLEQMLNVDAGARVLGEFAFGTNPNIKNYTRNILFDEKMGGTIHMALGASYPETGGLNQSAIHWDMVCDLRQNSEVYVDGQLFEKNGTFVV
ncbi:aminopeptidase [Herpetosiphon giganteus]|uniref:aminopeptidase n=1 Tax=Herpetosiphon giganteus TaxID=2029754 RepID=UPI00195EC07C|nr:aminopeptidase [Herpetosiphon giganteus]MBM7842935.1 aminopeptidase [Herpetosiphon giganteus]